MSIIGKIKNIFGSGCITEKEDMIKKDINNIQDALNLLNSIPGDQVQNGLSKFLKAITQIVHWIDILQQDMNIVKGDKLRSMLADITAIRQQITIINQNIDDSKKLECREHTCNDTKDIVVKATKVSKSIKDSKQKEKDHDNK